jgi:hypothetical protein
MHQRRVGQGSSRTDQPWNHRNDDRYDKKPNIATIHSSAVKDISAQKLYEESQLAHAQEREMLAKRRAEEADERRRAQGECRYHCSRDHPKPYMRPWQSSSSM